MTADHDFVVPARRWAEIGGIADNVRHRLGLWDDPRLPVMELLERVMDQRFGWFRLEVADHAEMEGAEGYTCPKGEFIRLREDVYAGAWRGDGRPRFTAAHELGHWAMHTNIPLARARRGDGTPAFRLAEPQANQFAAEILMPKRFITLSDDENALMERFGVSWEAARHRLSYLQKNGRS
jgi:Zn-dependent peptidase ImmA (M78 family)